MRTSFEDQQVLDNLSRWTLARHIRSVLRILPRFTVVVWVRVESNRLIDAEANGSIRVFPKLLFQRFCAVRLVIKSRERVTVDFVG